MAKKKPPEPAAPAETGKHDAPVQHSGNWFTRMLFRPRTLLVLALGAAATFAIPQAIPYLPDLRARPEYRLKTSEIQISEQPHWVPSAFLGQVIEQAGLPEELSLLDDGVAHRVAESFKTHPWVENVTRVEVSFPAKVTAEITFRRPVAMVAVRQGMYPIDASGTLLPPADFSRSETKLYPVIRNIRSLPRGGPGVNWGDPAVDAAARLAAAIETHWKRFGLEAIQAPERAGAATSAADLLFDLTTTGGSRIVWGRAPDSGHPGELTAAQKIGKLQEYLDRFGGFDQPHGPYEIEINHWQEIVRRPLSTRNAHIGKDSQKRR